MPNISRTKNWVANETLTAADLNAEYNGILTGVNDNALDADNLSTTDDYLLGALVLGSGIAATAGDGKLHVHVASAGSVSAHADANDITIENSANAGMTIFAGTTSKGSIHFGDSGDNDIGKIVYDHNTNDLIITANALEYMRFDSSTAAVNVVGAAGAPAILDLQTQELTVVDGNVLGRIQFKAPLESSGTDAILVGASIWAEADATFTSSVNTTDLVFAAATSETAGAVMRMKKASLSPETTDGMSLGTTALNWSDLFVDSGAVLNWDSGDVTLTHAAGKLTFGGDGAVELDFNNHEMTNVDVNSGAIDGVIIGGASVAAGSFSTVSTTGAATLASLACTAGATFGGGTGDSGATISTTGTGTFDGILKTEDTTDATSTTDGSLQTDGGLSVAKDAIVGNDLKLLSDSAVLALGDGSDATLTHDGTTGVTIAANPITITSATAATWSTSAGALTVNGTGGVNVQEGGATIIGISDSRVLSTSNTASIDMDATGAIAVNSSGGVISVANDNVDQNVNLATAGTRTLNIGILDGTDTTTITSKGNQTHSGTITVGADTDGYDVKFFGDTTGAYLLWDESADKLLTAGGALVDIVKDKFLIGGTAVTTTAAELNVLDAVTAGTVTASLGVVVDSNKDIGSFRNITLTGELDAGSLDVSGDANVAGEVQTAGIGFTDGDNAITIADGGGCTFPQTITATGDISVGDDILVATGGVINFASGDVTVTHAANTLSFAGATSGYQFDSEIVFINETANTQMTTGLTINQGSSDDSIFAGKSTDVNHPMTAEFEADTFFAFQKYEAGGGLNIRAYKDGSGAPEAALTLDGNLGEAAESTETTASDSVTMIRGFITNGSTGTTDVADGGNVFNVANRSTTHFLVKGNGDLYGSDTSITAFDDAEDVMVLRSAELSLRTDGLIPTSWDEEVRDRYHYDRLVDMGLIGYVSPDELAEGVRPLVNLSMDRRLTRGALWQGYIRDMELQKACEYQQEQIESWKDYQQEQIDSLKAELLLLKG